MKNLIFSLFFACIFCLGCKKSQDKKTPVSLQKTVKTQPLSKRELLRSYEAIRLALAQDNLALTQQKSLLLSNLLKETKATAGFNKLSDPVQKLSSVGKIEEARMAFGTLSREIISLLYKDNMKGITAYRCPMAKGYQKWIQTGAEMANPYMGKKMLKCGGKTKFEP